MRFGRDRSQIMHTLRWNFVSSVVLGAFVVSSAACHSRRDVMVLLDDMIETGDKESRGVELYIGRR